MPDQVIDKEGSRLLVAVACASRLIAKDPVELGSLRIDVAAVQAVDSNRFVDQYAAADGVNSDAKIEIRASSELLERGIIREKSERVAAKTICGGRRPDPLL